MTLLLAAVGLVVLARRARDRDAEVPVTPFDRLSVALATHGIERDRWQTPREYAIRVRRRRPEVDVTDLATVLADEEARRYGQREVLPPSPAAEAAAARIMAALVEDEATRPEDPKSGAPGEPVLSR